MDTRSVEANPVEAMGMIMYGDNACHIVGPGRSNIPRDYFGALIDMFGKEWSRYSPYAVVVLHSEVWLPHERSHQVRCWQETNSSTRENRRLDTKRPRDDYGYWNYLKNPRNYRREELDAYRISVESAQNWINANCHEQDEKRGNE